MCVAAAAGGEAADGGRPKGRFRQFEAAREYMHEQGLKGTKEWKDWCRAGKRPADIPSAPDQTYKDEGWVSWPHWLGTEFLPFEEARELSLSLPAIVLSARDTA